MLKRPDGDPEPPHSQPSVSNPQVNVCLRKGVIIYSHAGGPGPVQLFFFVGFPPSPSVTAGDSMAFSPPATNTESLLLQHQPAASAPPPPPLSPTRPHGSSSAVQISVYTSGWELTTPHCALPHRLTSPLMPIYCTWQPLWSRRTSGVKYEKTGAGPWPKQV